MVQVPPNYTPAIVPLTPPFPQVLNVPNLPPSPPSGGGTSSGGSVNNPSIPTIPQLPAIPVITDIGNYINSLLKTNIDPTLIGGLVTVLGILIFLWILGLVKVSPQKSKIPLPKLTV